MSHTAPPPESEIFSVERHEADGVRHLHLNGVIDEFADLSFLSHLQGDVVVHLGGVRRINSFGVRLWIDGVRSIPDDANVRFLEIPVPLVEQMNMVQDFFGPGRVESFLAPMACTSCESTENVLFRVADCTGGGDPKLHAKCSACGAALELDDIEEQYLAFLKDF